MAERLLDRPYANYPSGACDGYVSCSAILHVVISKTGTVEEATPVSGPPRLSVAVIDAVKRWKYKPYLLDGEPREVETTVSIYFNIGRSADAVPLAP
jgi:periplasmic protein TonB